MSMLCVDLNYRKYRSKSSDKTNGGVFVMRATANQNYSLHYSTLLWCSNITVVMCIGHYLL